MFHHLSHFLPSRFGGGSARSSDTEESAGKTGRSNELELKQLNKSADVEGHVSLPVNDDAFGDEEDAEIQYKTCAWW